MKEYFNGTIPEKNEIIKQIEIFDDAGKLSGRLAHVDEQDKRRFEELQKIYGQGFLIMLFLMNIRGLLSDLMNLETCVQKQTVRG